MAYLYIFLSAFCSLAITHLLKTAEVKGLRTLNTLTFNYLAAFSVAFSVALYQSGGTIPLPSLLLVLFCAVVGAFFIANFILYSKSIHANGVGVTVTFMRLSLLLPVIMSVLLYGELLNLLESAGVLLVIASLILLIPKGSKGKIGRINVAWLLVFVFLLSGFTDASLKIYKEEFSIQVSESFFMAMVFASAFIIGVVISLTREGILFTVSEMKYGTAIGIPNLYSSIFLIYALGDISGSIAYPTVNVINVAGGTLLGLAYWKDNVTPFQWAGLFIAITAIIILF